MRKHPPPRGNSRDFESQGITPVGEATPTGATYLTAKVANNKGHKNATCHTGKDIQ